MTHYTSPEAVRRHTESDLGVAAARSLANQDRRQASTLKPSSRDVTRARQTGAGNGRVAAPKNDENPPHCHREGSGGRFELELMGAGGLGFTANGKVKAQILHKSLGKALEEWRPR